MKDDHDRDVEGGVEKTQQFSSDEGKAVLRELADRVHAADVADTQKMAAETPLDADANPMGGPLPAAAVRGEPMDVEPSRPSPTDDGSVPAAEEAAGAKLRIAGHDGVDFAVGTTQKSPLHGGDVARAATEVLTGEDREIALQMEWPSEQADGAGGERERTGAEEFTRFALTVLSLTFPVLAGSVIATASINGWYAPATPALLFVLIAVPVSFGLRHTAETQVGSDVSRRAFVSAIVLGLVLCGSWGLGEVRGFLFESVSVDPSSRRRALSDPDTSVAAAACADALSRDQRRSTLAMVADTLATEALRRCAKSVPPGAAAALSEHYVRDFQQTLLAGYADELTCDDVSLLGELELGTAARWRSMWTCVAQRSNPPLRACCADSLRREGSAASGATDTLAMAAEGELPEQVLEWLLAASFHGFEIDRHGRAASEQLDLSSPKAREDVLRLTCNPRAPEEREHLLSHVQLAVETTCDAIPRVAANSLTGPDWFQVCRQAEQSGYDRLCPIVQRYLVGAAMEVAHGTVSASLGAFQHSAHTEGIKLGAVAERARQTDPGVQLFEERQMLSRDLAAPGREATLDTLRRLGDELEAERRADDALPVGPIGD
jgi:hypothetical protein